MANDQKLLEGKDIYTASGIRKTTRIYMMEKYNIKNMSVSIRTLTVDNKKFTKSMFNQLEPKICFDENINFIGEHIYGYVREKTDRHLIWVHKGKLRKSNLSNYYKISSKASRADYETTQWFCYKTKTEYILMMNIINLMIG